MITELKCLKQRRLVS